MVSAHSPRLYGGSVRENHTLKLEEAVRKMTSLSAANLGIANRGMIKPGYSADLVLFDPATVIDRSTIKDSRALSAGIQTVWVNGVIAFEKGRQRKAGWPRDTSSAALKGWTTFAMQP